MLPSNHISLFYISNNIDISASPGEYTSSSFVLNSDSDVTINIDTSNLIGDYEISKNEINIRAVKCWYKGGIDTADYSVKGRYLSPELLLKDDSLISVDGDIWGSWNVSNPIGKNYLKVNDAYLDISNEIPQRADITKISIIDRPIQDAPTLKPVTISNNYNKQFWITTHIPLGTVPGNYIGIISIKVGTRIIKQIRLNLTVLPITLPDPGIEYSVYYRGTIRGSGSISSDDKTVEQYTAEMQNMLQHGVTNPTLWPFDTDENLITQLSIRQQVGIDNTNLYYVGAIAPENIQHYKDITSQYGVVDVFQYGPDEQSIDNPTYRSQITNIHNAGGKYFVAQSISHADTVYDILDIAVARRLSPALATKYHLAGNKVYAYHNPQTVSNTPRYFRMNYGLAIWQSDYDGVMDYAYQHSMGDIWNDFDYTTFRDHVFAYPTQNGVIDTIKWEGFREGINDVRYLQALINKISDAKTMGINTTDAENYLLALKTLDLTSLDLDLIRSQIINYILYLESMPRLITVNGGIGTGYYTTNTSIIISSNVSPNGIIFDKWIGDTEYINDVSLEMPTLTVPDHSVILSATYKINKANWFDFGYAYGMVISINHTKVSNIDQFDFPFFISITDENLKTIANGGHIQTGYDFIFVLPDGTLLNYELSFYDGSTGSLLAWVKIPIVSALNNTFVCMYYGNPNVITSQENKNAVWDSNYLGVWHLGESGTGQVGNYKDSTSNLNHSINTTNQPALINNAQLFDGATNYIDGGQNPNLNVSNKLTIDVIIKRQSYEANTWIVDFRTNGGALGYFLAVDSYDKLRLDLGTNTYRTTYVLNWDSLKEYYITVVFSDNQITWYRNGTQIETIPGSANTNNIGSLGHLIIGAQTGTYDRNFNGTIRELRISNTARQADRIITEYNNQYSPSTFYTVGEEESLT